MFSLRLASYLLVAPALMGVFVIAVLSLDMGTATNISVAAIAGAVLGLPAAWVLAKLINEAIKPKSTN